ncbi:flavodoxin-like protein [Kribbella antiqua]|uniref:Flavodoxin-like protein n=1 Tax=Kribbella antiqua TaxID=2512217 RepID=A0A4V6NNP6_9ACTN|nr:flavodoxin [Kribbella antiqua]TCO51120.1 flavodoxin-like protein [Kribbella antiqua]
MIMSTFTESHDFTGATVHPFTTYAMSGLGTTERDYARSCPGGTIGEGLAVRGEQAGRCATSGDRLAPPDRPDHQMMWLGLGP